MIKDDLGFPNKITAELRLTAGLRSRTHIEITTETKRENYNIGEGHRTYELEKRFSE